LEYKEYLGVVESILNRFVVPFAISFRRILWFFEPLTEVTYIRTCIFKVTLCIYKHMNLYIWYIHMIIFIYVHVWGL
jgi:hypothetical protein